MCCEFPKMHHECNFLISFGITLRNHVFGMALNEVEKAELVILMTGGNELHFFDCMNKTVEFCYTEAEPYCFPAGPLRTKHRQVTMAVFCLHLQPQ